MLKIMRLYLRLLGTHVRASLEYEADFWISAFGAAMTQVAGFVFIAAVFARVPDINGWSFWTVTALFGVVALTEGILNLFAEGLWFMAQMKHQGEYDYYLVRPYPVVLQVLSSHVGLNGLGNVVTGGVMVGVGLAKSDLEWSPGTVLLTVVVLTSAVVVRLGILLAAASSAFWVEGPSAIFAFSVHQLGDLAKYPLAIYPSALKVVLGVVLPFAFVSFYPISLLTGDGDTGWLGLLTPLVAAYCLGTALWIFKRGLLRYESAGN